MSLANILRRRGAARIPLIDAVRGIAIVAMFAFHLTWDLSFFGYIDPRIVFNPAFRVFAETIGSTFLSLAGLSLVLAHVPRFRARAYLSHLAIIIAAAGAVSVATYIFVPEGFIFFGILHCIALASLIALPFLFLPWWIVGIAALLVIAAPRLFVSPSFDAPIWWWTGLSTFEPRTNDYWPILPWAGVLLLGLAAMKLGDRFASRERLARWQPRNLFSRGIVFGGRHSLAVYLVHQPIFFGLVWLSATIVPPHGASAEAHYMSSCRAQCEDVGQKQTICSAVCTCIADELREQDLWMRTIANRLQSEERQRLAQIARSCLRKKRRLEEE
ncbi:MAG TPA: heparan-alpha-glucosaminide N-acetyltransferase [Beijerinckiaceae bacterium]|nr:heparan-alpha-glucosaminide N-acetyltransferase [Beijerinckiaceae bacterium]